MQLLVRHVLFVVILAGVNVAGPDTAWCVDRPTIHQLDQARFAVHADYSEKQWDNYWREQAGAPGAAPSLAPPPAVSTNYSLRKEVFGWHPYWSGSGYTNYNASLLTTIAYFSYEADPATGYATTMHSWSNTALIGWAHARNIKVVLTVTLFSGHSTFLGSDTSKSNMIQELIRLVQLRGADGVNLDFEGMTSSSLRAPFTGFVSNLASRMHAAVPGSRISIALPSVDWGAVFDVAAYNAFVDQCLLMGYDYYWSTAPYSGPVAPLRGSSMFGVYCVGRSVSNYIASGLAPGKLLLAVPYYGYEWGTLSSNLHSATTGSGTAQLYPAAISKAATYGRRWDTNSLTPYYTYGSFQQGWYEDAESLGLKYDFATEQNLGGVGIWALGYDGTRPDLWELLAEKFAMPVTGTPAVVIASAGASISHGTLHWPLAGTSTNCVGSMHWTNSLGGAGDLTAGGVWTAAVRALSVGTNVITVWGTNGVGVTASAQIALVRAGPGPVEMLTVTPEPGGALSNIIVYCSGGHGFHANTTASEWRADRVSVNGLVEDVGNQDQLTLFAQRCLEAGATVVPMRPVGHQTNEVVLDNDDAGVTFSGAWSNGSSTIFFGSTGDVPFRVASVCTTGETAFARYRPAIPQDGFYPVYTWVRRGGDRVRQLYRIGHDGGVSLIRVNHRRVGLGWVWLGTYYFTAGTNGYVDVSNDAPGADPGGVVVADALRFGNGMGNIDRGFGVSGYERELEASRYWIQNATQQGMDSGLYDRVGYTDAEDDIGAPARMADNMDDETDGTFFDRVYIGLHSNADGGAGTGRGAMGLYSTGNSAARQLQQRELGQALNDEIEADMEFLDQGVGFNDDWSDNSVDVYGASYGEISEGLNGNMNATIMEVAYHNNTEDAKLLKDLPARDSMARACVNGLVKYLHARNAGVPLVLPPNSPSSVCAINSAGGTLTVSWLPSVTNAVSSDPAAEYRVYMSTSGYGFGRAWRTSDNRVVVTNLIPGSTYYFRVTAVNEGGESSPSEVVGARLSPSGKAPHLVVNGFTRRDRSLSPTRYFANNIDGYSAMLWARRINSSDYVVQHGSALAAAHQYFDSCSHDVLLQGDVDLTKYRAAYWILGEESVVNETFSDSEQTLLDEFLSGGGCLFASGAEIAWDLDHMGSTTDKGFFTDRLKSTYVADDSGVYDVAGAAGSIFGGLNTFRFDGGSGATYRVDYPDVIAPAGGSTACLRYGTGGSSGDVAAVQYDGSFKLVYMAFPFETIERADDRNALLGSVVRFFGATDTQAPSLFAFNVSGSSRTDAELSQGFVISGSVHDEDSGLRVDKDTPYFLLRNAAGNIVIASNRFDTVPSPAATSGVVSEAVAPLVPGAIDLGTYTLVAGAGDLEGNSVETNLLFAVVDDDVDAPQLNGFGIAGVAAPFTYPESRSSNSFTEVGSSRNWHFDDRYMTSAIAFAFPFFGGSYTQCFVDTNGRITFQRVPSDYTESVGELASNSMIAVLWNDLCTTNTYGDVFVESASDHLTVRWAGDYRPGAGGGVVRASATLKSDGDIVLKYGPGNERGGLVGISAGDGRYVLAAINATGSLHIADDVTFNAGWVARASDYTNDWTVTGLVQDVGSGVVASGSQAPQWWLTAPGGTTSVVGQAVDVRPAVDGAARTAPEPLGVGVARSHFMSAGDYTVRVQVVDADADRVGDALNRSTQLVLRVLSPYVAPPAVLVISEIMADPSASSDSYGEWFELYNAGVTGIDVNGWTIRDDVSNVHVISNGGPLIVPGKGFLVLGRSTNLAVNGGVAVQYKYANMALGNTADQVVLLRGTTVMARVAYEGSAPWPYQPGSSIELSAPDRSMSEGSNWVLATTAWLGGAGDRGTPGAPNRLGDWGAAAPELPLVAITNGDFTVSNQVNACSIGGTSGGGVTGHLRWTNSTSGTWGTQPIAAVWTVTNIGLSVGANIVLVEASNVLGQIAQAHVVVTRSEAVAGPVLVISEIMQNPAASSDTYGEWFELHNPGPVAIDINGWKIRDDGSNTHTINNGGALLVPAAGCLVLGRSSNLTLNGGAPVQYVYSNFTLNNGADQIVLLQGSSVVARVDYDGGPTWPDPDGASMELMGLAGGQNDGTNWTGADAVWSGSAGDKGSPGIFAVTRNRKTSWDPIATLTRANGAPTVQLQSEGAATWVWWTDDLREWPTNQVTVVYGDEWVETNAPSDHRFYRFSTKP